MDLFPFSKVVVVVIEVEISIRIVDGTFYEIQVLENFLVQEDSIPKTTVFHFPVDQLLLSKRKILVPNTLNYDNINIDKKNNKKEKKNRFLIFKY
jgi:hypothetical protein